MRLRLALPCALALAGNALAGCDAFSNAPAEDPGSISGGRPFTTPPGVRNPGGVAGGVDTGIDFGQVVTSDVPPVAIQGGTLLVMRDGHTAVAADPDRDRVLVADLTDGEVLATLDLLPGDEPGRLTEDASGRVHIVLRRAGMIATLDVAARALVDRRDVCLAPQGIAYAQATDALLVACTEGDLVELPAAGGARTRVTRIDGDLRDVNVVAERVLVSRFKSAELVELDIADLRVLRRTRPADITGPFANSFGEVPQRFGSDGQLVEPEPATFAAGTAFRTLADGGGRVVMLHQRAQSSEIDLQVDDVHDGTSTDEGVAGGGGSEFGQASEGSDPYGGGDMCGSIVRPALSVVGPDGMSSGPVLPVATLAVDAAFSPDGRWVAVGVAGSNDVSERTFGSLSQLSALVLSTDTVMGTTTPEGDVGTCPVPGMETVGSMLSAGQAVAVAFDQSNRLIVQTREPAALHVFTFIDGCLANCEPEPMVIPLGGLSRRDTGHDLFHNDAGAGLSCGSCHPGGAEDGHTWVFSGLGPRRTQLFNMGIEDTLPLHWDGDLPTFSDLVNEVFVRRMGGADLTGSQISAMESWIGTLEPGTPLRLATDPAAERGKALFESEAVQCASCHTGSMLTNNMTVDVGTGAPMQVPSLIGVAHHAPWIHTGCAQTLRDRFDPACGGGDKHGRTSHLTDAEIDDLVAYLESL